MRFAFLLVVYFHFSSFRNSKCLNLAKMKYKLTKTWDDHIPKDNPEVDISITRVTQAACADKDGLIITVDAPFYNDPKLPSKYENTPGRVPGLWDYEVVEVFFLGANQNYLEIELGPKGHYLVYFLQGVRNVTKDDILLEDYSANVENTSKGMRWTGKAFIPFSLLPSGVSSFNAYAIHGSDSGRRYMSLFPVPAGKFKIPDFHRLEYFKPISFKC